MLRSGAIPLALATAAALMMLSGCASFSKPDAAAPLTSNKVWNGDEAVRLSYRLDAGQMGAPLAISCVQAQQVSYQEVEASPISDRSVGVLDIQYPHPAGREGMALVGVVIQRQDGPERGMPPAWIQRVRGWFRWPDENTIVGSRRDLHEAWVMDVPKAELDQILAELQQAGYYESAERNRGHVRLTSRVGGKFVTKDWSTVPRLDQLMHRARSHGQLVSYQGIAMPLEQRPSAPASVVAWRALHDEQAPSRETSLAENAARQQSPVFSPPSGAGGHGLLPANVDQSQNVARLPQAGPWR